MPNKQASGAPEGTPLFSLLGLPLGSTLGLGYVILFGNYFPAGSLVSTSAVSAVSVSAAVVPAFSVVLSFLRLTRR